MMMKMMMMMMMTMMMLIFFTMVKVIMRKKSDKEEDNKLFIPMKRLMRGMIGGDNDENLDKLMILSMMIAQQFVTNSSSSEYQELPYLFILARSIMSVKFQYLVSTGGRAATGNEKYNWPYLQRRLRTMVTWVIRRLSLVAFSDTIVMAVLVKEFALLLLSTSELNCFEILHHLLLKALCEE